MMVAPNHALYFRIPSSYWGTPMTMETSIWDQVWVHTRTYLENIETSWGTIKIYHCKGAARPRTCKRYRPLI